MDKTYSVSDVAKMLNRHPQTIISYITAGTLKATQPGGKKYLITQAALDEFLNPPPFPSPKK